MLILAVLSLLLAVVAGVFSVVALRRTGASRRVGADALPTDVHGLRQEVAALRKEARRRERTARISTVQTL